MKYIEVKTSNKEYKIYIKNNIAELFCDYIKENIGKDCTIIIITNEKVHGIYGKKIKDIIGKEYEAKEVILNDGEKYKNIDTLKYIYSQLLDFNVHRNDAILPLGGGVIGDTAGFAAATFGRGMKLIHCPTTVISQIDSSIGGKTAVNFERVKNIIGCFYQPDLILTDPEFLKTLDEKEIINGLGEIVKYGLVFDFQIINDILSFIENAENDKDRLFDIVNDVRFNEIIYKCARIKAEIVERDEYDLNERNLLNFGHTIGHSIEKTLGFNKINHGQAVAIGILCAIDISINLGYLSKKFMKKILDVYDILKLPKCILKSDADAIMDSLKFDKKFSVGKNKFILLKDLNKPVIYDGLDENIIRNSINSHISHV